MKNQALFSSKDKSKKLKCRLLQFLIGAIRVNFVPALSLRLQQYGHIRNIESFNVPLYTIVTMAY